MTICRELRRAAALRPHGTALLCDDRRLDWSQLLALVERLAGVLVGLEVAPGDRIAIIMPNGIEYVALFAAIPWAGAVMVPLNTRWTARERAEAILDCGATMVITSIEFFEEIDELAKEHGFAHVSTDPRADLRYDLLLGNTDPVPSREPGPSELYAIFYTGGTTGRSKGVMLSHASIAHTALAAIAEHAFGPDEVYMHTSPPFHIAGAWAVVAMIMSTGVSVVLPRFDAENVLANVERHGVTQTLLVPAMIQMVIDHPLFTPERLRSLRRILYGASPITQALLDRAGAILPFVGFTQFYGMTETSSQCSTLDHSLLGPEDTARHRSAGRPTYGMEVRIVNPGGNFCAPHVFGEIVTRGPGLMMGYWNQPEATALALKSGWMHTGDGGYVDEEGFVFVSDRIKDMIVTGGENVFSIEVENVLAAHPGVRQCAVFAVPHERWVEQVHAAVVLHHGVAPDVSALTAWCKERLAGYKVPRSFDFHDALPMSGPGKILKRTLRDAYLGKVSQ